MARFQSPLALKIVFPFALLTAVIGAVGTVAATSELSARGQQAFDRQLIHDGFVAQTDVGNSDLERQAILRLLAANPSINSIWNNPGALQTRLEGALAVRPDAGVEAVDPYGREIVGVFGRRGSPAVSQNADLSGWPGLQYFLSGGDGPKADLVLPAPRPAVFAGELVHDQAGALLGAVMVGDYLDDRAAAIKAGFHVDVTFYDTHGQVLSTTLGVPPGQRSSLALDLDTRNRVGSSSGVQLQRTLPSPGTEWLAPWASGTTSLGYVGVTASMANLGADATQLRLIMVLLLVTGVVLTLLIGFWLARRITRPVYRLVEATRLVSAGHLDHQTPVTTHDEIAELTASFNHMTRSLKEQSVSLNEAMSQLQDTYLMTIEALAAAVEARDPYTHGHTRRVGDYSLVMANALGVGEADVNALRRASVLHDIGKIAIEDKILRKHSRLEPDEEIRMQRHPIIGVDMLNGIDFLEPLLPLIRHHHERWDGNGYPDQLCADQIPLGARILAVADALDAMTSDRPYRPARTFEFAKAEILKGSGTQFDAEVVTAFIKSQREIEELMRHSPDAHEHPEPGDVGGWRLHVVGR